MIKLNNTNRFLEESINACRFLERFSTDEIIDPILMRSIALQCLEVLMDIMQRCLKYEPK
ncbi:hypothetical protein RYX36_008946 [Vicia faba]